MTGEKTIRSNKLGIIIDLHNTAGSWFCSTWKYVGLEKPKCTESTNYGADFVAADNEYKRKKRELEIRENQLLSQELQK